MDRMVQGLWGFRDIHLCRLVNFYKVWLDDWFFWGNVQCEVLVSQVFGIILRKAFKVSKKPRRHVTQSEVDKGIDTECVIVEIVNVRPLHVQIRESRLNVAPSPF